VAAVRAGHIGREECSMSHLDMLISLAREARRRPSILAALAQLLEASELACSDNVSAEEYAVELPCLLQRGVTSPALHKLIRAGCITQIPANDQIMERSRFVLTPAGIALARQVCPAGHAIAMGPRWDRENYELWFGDQLLLRLTPRAISQIPILDAFEDDGWNACIADPLPGNGKDRHKRLLNAVQQLNAGLLAPVIRFHTNGGGDGVRWELVRPPKTGKSSAQSERSHGAG
jgi:hypothetical protein